jgi:hypothetical protein
MLHDDPNPDETGANEHGDRDRSQNHHAMLLRNEDIRFITTVRGHLCWLMSQLIAQNAPEQYTRIIEILDRYAESLHSDTGDFSTVRAHRAETSYQEPR